MVCLCSVAVNAVMPFALWMKDPTFEHKLVTILLSASFGADFQLMVCDALDATASVLGGSHEAFFRARRCVLTGGHRLRPGTHALAVIQCRRTCLFCEPCSPAVHFRRIGCTSLESRGGFGH